MKKLSRFVIVGVVALMAIAGATMVFAQEDGTTAESAPAFVQEDAPADGPRNGRRGNGELRELASQVFDKDEMKAAVADAFGLTVEELEAAKEDGTLRELAEAQGVDREAVKAAVQAYRETAVADAIAAGTITDEQGEQLLSHDGKCNGKKQGRGGRLGRFVDREVVAAAIADTLGISVEDLQAAKEDGTSMEELAAENGVELEDIRAAIEVVKTEAVQQAVEDGTITQEQADRILSGEGRRGKGGFGGNRGGDAPAPAVDSEA
ncbi:MAG: hypothetical protein AAF614_33470 [Chloroflexota bacterium]